MTNNIGHYEPSPELYNKVVLRIRKEQRMTVARRKIVLFSSFMIFSAVASVPMWKIFWEDIIRSGIGQYLALLFSDFQTVTVYWQDFSLTLLEALPTVSLAGALALLLFLLWSLRSIIRYGQILVDLKHIHSRQ